MKTNKKSVQRHSRLTYTTKRSIAGVLFILPWFIGAIYFFVIPFIQGIVFTVNKINFTSNGVQLTFIGLSNYKKAINDLDFIKVFTKSIGDMFPRVTIIVFFSLFIAIILKGEFRGRTLSRAIFFLPVVISSGVVITVLQENIMGTDLSGKEASYLVKIASFETTLSNLGLSTKMLTMFSDIINQLFDLSWKSGVQILLLLAAVNNIPKSSYEVADIEGATEWEKFWKITFPMVSPIIFVAIIYTVIDSFTDFSNKVMRMISDQLSNGYYEYSSTMAFIYFTCVLVIIGLVSLLISRRIVYQVD